MTGMVGSAGLLKGYASKARADAIRAPSVRLDDMVQRDLCLLKADVEGYEPQVFQTATRLLSLHAVPSLQFELSKGNVPSVGACEQSTCETPDAHACDHGT